jgi:hypothetical protein
VDTVVEGVLVFLPDVVFFSEAQELSDSAHIDNFTRCPFTLIISGLAKFSLKYMSFIKLLIFNQLKFINIPQGIYLHSFKIENKPLLLSLDETD